MKRFLRKILILLLPFFVYIAFMLFVLIKICPQYTHEYTAAFIDKMNRLNSITEPKIILVSNSNLAFGIQSEIIEKEIGMPVVNLGLHGGLGNAFHERMALFNLHKGDIIVISHLDYSDDDSISDPELALLTVENYFHYWKIFRLKDYPSILGTLPKYTYKCFNRFMNKEDKEPSEITCYARSAFNEYGDNVFPRNVISNDINFELRHPGVSKTCMKRINNFYKYCQKKDITVVITGAPIICGLENFNEDEYKQFQQKLQSLTKCPVISDFSDYFFDKQYFYENNLHLNNNGAKLRTEQLVKDLKSFLAIRTQDL